MTVAVRKIDLMHRQFGKIEGEQCKDCSNLITNFWDKKYYKCSVYGVSNSEATDWRLKYQACGLFNKETTFKNVVKMVRADRLYELNGEQLEGQLSMLECVNDAEVQE